MHTAIGSVDLKIQNLNLRNIKEIKITNIDSVEFSNILFENSTVIS